MFDLPLQIFPGGGFDSSIITVVFVGLLVMWALTETMGFVFIGLVVPGYLASVMAIAPTPAVVVIVESIVTYVLVWVLSDGFSRLGVWSMSFGRDRFFAFLLVSLLVRLVGELWLWPLGWQYWTQWSGLSPQLPGALTSVGLVLVPLAANMFWKLGLARGAWQIGLPTAAVYAITVNLLLPLTNLRFSEFQVHYEDVAIDIIASPKAYVIMIVAAAFAARANIRFGWDSGGILIPALLAVAWFDASKVFVTIAEAILLMVIATITLRAPIVKKWNMEGPRRIVFVFGLGYLLKYLLAWTLHVWLPHVRVTDFFGFGYLLSSLLALKMLQRKKVSVVLIPTLIVSFAGFVTGGVLVAGLSGLAAPPGLDTGSVTVPPGQTAVWENLLVGAVQTGDQVHGGDPIRADELARWEQLVSRLVSSRKTTSWPDASTQRIANEMGLEMTVARERAGPSVMIAEPIRSYPQTRGWGSVVITNGGDGPLLLVPDTDGDPTRALAVAELARRIDACAVLFGARAETPAGRVLEPRYSSSSPYHIAARQLRGFDIVEVVFTSSGALWIETAVGKSFPLAPLSELVDSDQVEWAPYPAPPIQRSLASHAYATLGIDERGVLRLAAALGGRTKLVPRNARLLELLQDRLFGPERIIASSLVELGTPVSAGEQEAARRAVVQPLLDIADSPPTALLRRRTVSAAVIAATSLGLEVTRIAHEDECWWIVNDSPSQLRGWGLTAIRCTGGAPLTILNPFPLRETSSWRFAATLAQQFNARSLAIGAPMRAQGASPRGSALHDPSLLSAVHRGTTIGTLVPWAAPVWTLEVRGLGAATPLDADILITTETPMRLGKPDRALGIIAESLQRSGVRSQFDDGALDWASLRGQRDAPLGYARAVSEGRFAKLWLSAKFRDRLSPEPSAEEIDWLARSREIPLAQSLGELAQTDVGAEDLLASRDELVQIAQRFSTTRNPLTLEIIVERLRRLGAAPAIWREPDRRRMWLVTSTKDGRVFGLRVQKAELRLHVEAFEPLAGMSAASFLLEEPP